MNDCTFCRIVAGELPAWRVYEDERVLAFFDIGPVAEYHTLVVPKRHSQDILDVPEDDLRAVATAIKKITALYESRAGIRNMQIVCSSGREAQQDVMHLHFHIVPRRSGDGQNIAWTAYPALRDRFDDLLERLKPAV